MTSLLSKFNAKEKLANGLMITASHNPIVDNGVKISDTEGGMIAESLEKHIVEFVNGSDIEEDIKKLLDVLQEFFKRPPGENGIVILGGDTRPSSENLLNLAKEGVILSGSVPIVLGQVATPTLAHAVREYNMNFVRVNEAKYFADNTNILVNQYIEYYLDNFFKFNDLLSSPNASECARISSFTTR